MKISQVLSAQQRRPSAVPSNAPARAVVRRLAASPDRVVVVTSPRGRVMGTVTDHDVVVALASNGEPLSALSVVDLLGRSTACCRSDDEVADVIATMTREGQRHLPVLDRDALAGVVSLDDLIGEPEGDLDLREAATSAPALTHQA